MRQGLRREIHRGEEDALVAVFRRQGLGNEIAQRFGISGIPATFLVGKDGKIVASNLRGPALEEAIEKALEASEPAAAAGSTRSLLEKVAANVSERIVGLGLIDPLTLVATGGKVAADRGLGCRFARAHRYSPTHRIPSAIDPTFPLSRGAFPAIMPRRST